MNSCRVKKTCTGTDCYAIGYGPSCDAVRLRASRQRGLRRFSLRALATTEIELNAIAAPASIGFSNQ
jgi:hypothetical protein